MFAHHQHHQGAGKDIGKEGGGTGLGDRMAGEDEEAGADHAAEVVEDLTRSLPSGSDIVDVEALREDGKVVIEYGQSLLEADPQVLEDTMREAADRARDAIPDLEDVEFRVGDRTFTY